MIDAANLERAIALRDELAKHRSFLEALQRGARIQLTVVERGQPAESIFLPQHAVAVIADDTAAVIARLTRELDALGVAAPQPSEKP